MEVNMFDGGGPEGHRPCLHRCAGTRCGRGLYGAGKDLSDAPGHSWHCLLRRLGPVVGGGLPAGLRGRPVTGRGAHPLRGSAAVQKIADGGKTTNAAWRTKPTFYAVSTQDRTINPELQRFMAKRMGARTIEIEASHLALISHPDAITNLILEALAV